MTKIRFTKGKIRLSELHTQSVTVPAWEFPVLQAVHGERAQELGETLIERNPPEAADEYRRLATKYRGPDSGDTAYVAAVYGAFGPGIGNLQRAINEATVAEAKADDDMASLVA